MSTEDVHAVATANEEAPLASDPVLTKEVVPEESTIAAKSEESDDRTNRKDRPYTLTQSAKVDLETKTGVTLSFENLTVHVPGQSGKCCNCLDSPFKYYAKEYLGLGVEAKEPFDALKKVSGYLEEGEMVLVLTANEQCSSTFIKSLTGRLSTHDDLQGSILLNGLPLGRDKATLQGWRRLAPYVSATDTTHSPILTVKETIMFAARCTSDGSLPESTLEVRIDRLLKILGIDHVADTVVGDDNLRGISGGQKRRVTVAEMMTDRKSLFLGLENITDGLASVDSFNLIQKLAQTCDAFKLSAMISLLQPSDEIVNLFDKILVLTNSGELAYFGPVDRQILRDIFIGKDADPALDSGSICDLVLNHSVGDPEKDDAVIQRFLQSNIHAEMISTLQEIRARAPPDLGVRDFFPETRYSSSYGYQLRTIASRRLLLIVRNAATYMRAVIAIVFGTIIGSLFSALNNDLIGSLSRTGYLFLNMFLVLMLSAAVTIPQTFRDRVTLFKHRSAEFYSGRVAYVTQVLLDIPLSLLEACLLSSISYYWVDMREGPDHFFYFFGVLVGLEFVGQAFGRLLCATSRTQVYANSLSSVALLLFGTVACFMPAYSDIPPIFQWLSWITPGAYAFEAMMLNEFVGRNITGIVISGDGGTTTEVATIEGHNWIRTFGLPRNEWGSTDDMKAFNIAMIFALSLVFDLLGWYFVENTRDWYFNQIRRSQKTAKSKAFVAQTESEIAASKVAEMKSIASHWPNTLAIKDLSYFVKIKDKHAPKSLSIHSLLGPCLVYLARKKQGADDNKIKEVDTSSNELQLLKNVDATFSAGRMTALMGTSGAGKTTLLDVIAGYKTGGRIAGHVTVDGQPIEADMWTKITGYAEQTDILNPYLSVLETLRFTAACRLPVTVNREQVIADVIRLMGIGDWKDVEVGRESEDEGLPKHVRKRLTIAVQLVVRPRILFADEPTTGLGTTAANLVIQAIRRCTDEMGLITIATIHQPSKLIWDSFDDLLLLIKGGKLAYMGEMGADSTSVLKYFAELSNQSPPAQANPADFVLSAVGRCDIDDAVTAFKGSSMYSDLAERIDASKSEAIHTDSIAGIRKEMEQGSSHWKEFRLLYLRHSTTQWRNPSYSMMRLACSIGVSLYMGILFRSEKSQISGAVASIGAIFFLVFVLVIPMQATIIPLIEDRAVLYREATSGMYSRFSYGLGQVAADIPFHALNGLLMFVAFYFLVDFRLETDLMGYFIAMLFLANWVIMSLGQLFALATPNEESATGLAGLSVILSVILMGFLIMYSAMPDGWKWAYWANLFHYIVQGFVTNELAGREYEIDLLELIGIPSGPSNATNAFVFEAGTDLSVGSTAMQSSAFLGLAIESAPGINNSTTTTVGIVALGALVKCLVQNDCLVEPIRSNLLRCIIHIPPPLIGQAPCTNEFDAAASTIWDVVGCFRENVNDDENSTETVVFDGSGGSILGAPNDFGADQIDAMTEEERRDLVQCLIKALLPPELIDIIRIVLEILNDVFGVVVFIIELLKNGIQLPGELILFVFGWAELREGEFVANGKWWYCFTSVLFFLMGIETIKLLAVQYIVWTKR